MTAHDNGIWHPRMKQSDDGPLKCDAVWFGWEIAKFRWQVSPPSSRAFLIHFTVVRISNLEQKKTNQNNSTVMCEYYMASYENRFWRMKQLQKSDEGQFLEEMT